MVAGERLVPEAAVLDANILARRDEEDRPVLATALALECSIWTDDADIFGAGVATWTTDRVELLLREFEYDAGEPAAE